MWQPLLMTDVSVSLTSDAMEAIDWVNQKRVEEHKIKALAERHPAVADGLDAVEQAKTKLKIITELVQT
jgi:hypothetical protein